MIISFIMVHYISQFSHTHTHTHTHTHILVGLWFKLRALHLQSSALSLEPQLHFVLVILEMESQEVFAQTGLKPWSSQSLSLARIADVSYPCLASIFIFLFNPALLSGSYFIVIYNLFYMLLDLLYYNFWIQFYYDVFGFGADKFVTSLFQSYLVNFICPLKTPTFFFCFSNCLNECFRNVLF
jgi:hypothetical protein